MLAQSLVVTLFLEPKKSILPFHSITCVNTALKCYEKSSPGFTDSFIMNNFKLLSAPNNKAFPNGKCLINVEKTNDKKRS